MLSEYVGEDRAAEVDGVSWLVLEELLVLLELGLCCDGDELRLRRKKSGLLDDVKMLVRDVFDIFRGDVRGLSDEVLLG